MDVASVEWRLAFERFDQRNRGGGRRCILSDLGCWFFQDQHQALCSYKRNTSLQLREWLSFGILSDSMRAEHTEHERKVNLGMLLQHPFNTGSIR